MKTTRSIISHIAFAGRTFPSGHVSQDFTAPSMIVGRIIPKADKIKIRAILSRLNQSRMFLR